jgi:hypothetical protein
MATGSGKTLLMHAHILQYRRFLETHGRARELNRIILLTPNEGLSQQHLREFEKAGIDAEIFNKDGRGLFAGQTVEILEVTKLKEEMGEKTVAVDAFEGNNLVLVDEGHRGASAGGDGAWMKYRNALCEKGFSFEYSATFGQAVKGSQALTDLYARSILFDYSYRWFYGDGVREGLPNPEPGGRQQRGVAEGLPHRLSARLLPAATPLPGAGGHVPALQPGAAFVDLRGRQRDGNPGDAGCLGHCRDPALPRGVRNESHGQRRADPPCAARRAHDGLGQKPLRRSVYVSKHLRTLARADLRRNAEDDF